MSCVLWLLIASCASGPPVPADVGDATMEQADGVEASVNRGAVGDLASDAALSSAVPSHADRLRLPDMETLPENEDIKSVKPSDSGIIARPPLE